MDEERKRTRAQEKAHIEMMLILHESEVFLRDHILRREQIPREWHQMEKLAPCIPKRTKVTLRVDDRTVRWFRSLGTGWHHRVDRVLQSYMLAMISKEIEGEADRDRLGDPI